MRTRPISALLVTSLFMSAGCSLMPADKSTSFHQHIVARAETNSQKISDRKDQAEFLAAHQRLEQNDVAGCREQLESLLARNPKHCEARLLLADVLLRSSQPQEALGQVQEALKYHAEDPDVQYAMGLTLDVNGRADEALAYYERATKGMPGNEAYALSYHTASEAAQQRKSPAANHSTRLQPAAPAQPAPPPPPVAAADVSVNQPVAPMVAQFDASPDAAPIVTPTTFESEVGVAVSQPDEHSAPQPGTASVHAMGEHNPQDPQHNPQYPQSLVAAATDALKHHDAKRAVDILTPAAERYPKSPAIFRTLGIAHLQTGELTAAQKDLEQSLSLDKSSALSYFLMGCTLTKLGQREAADANLRQAAALDPRYSVRP